MVVVVVLLAVLHKLIDKVDGAGAVEAVVDFPGCVAGLGIAHLQVRNEILVKTITTFFLGCECSDSQRLYLSEELRQSGVEMLVLQFVGTQDGFDLGRG